MEGLIFLVHNQSDNIKARTVANGSTQRAYTDRDAAAKRESERRLPTLSHVSHVHQTRLTPEPRQGLTKVGPSCEITSNSLQAHSCIPFAPS